MSALKLNTLRLSIFSLFLFFSFFILIPSTQAVVTDQQGKQVENGPAESGKPCLYNQEQNDGIYVCDGSWQLQDETNTQLVCKYNPGVNPACKKVNPDSSTTNSSSTSKTPVPVDSNNYKAPQHSNYTVVNLEHSLFCELTGMSPVDKCLGITDDGSRKIVLYNPGTGGGAFASLNNFMVAMYTNPPTSTSQYLASLKNNFLVKPAYAQVGGSGAGIVEPIRILWQVTRNLSYVAFILVFVAVGFLIMMRARINPQTVISAQAALPGLVVGLILVTFSYFLAALLIDTSFVAVQLVGQVFIQVDSNPTQCGSTTNNPILTPTRNCTNNVLNVGELKNSSNIFNLFMSTVQFPQNVAQITGGTFNTISSVFGGGNTGNALTFLIPAVIGAIIGTIVFPGAGTLAGIGAGIGAGTALGVGAGAIFTGIIGLIVPLILIIALLIQFFRLLWKLIGSYIALLVTTVIGPFVILYSSIPGKGGSMSFWWKTLLANSLVFPAVFAAFLFAGMILSTSPESWKASPPLFGGLSTELLRLIIAYGIILGTPAIPDLVKNALGVKDIAGIPQEAMAGIRLGGNVAGTAAPDLGRGVATGGSRILAERATAPGAPRWLSSFTNRLEQLSHPPPRR